jgi:hypothetical protein
VVHASKQEVPAARAMRRPQKIKMRLGGSNRFLCTDWPFDKRQKPPYLLNPMIDPTIKAAAVALLKSGEMRVAEVAELTGQSRQLVATWCPGALEARREWCRQRWKDAAKGVGNAVALRPAVNGSASVHAETTK